MVSLPVSYRPCDIIAGTMTSTKEEPPNREDPEEAVTNAMKMQNVSRIKDRNTEQ